MDVCRLALRLSNESLIFLGPGSFTEVQKVLPLLIQGGSDYPAFHVVALGIPGFGFSEAPTKPGFALGQYAEV